MTEDAARWTPPERRPPLHAHTWTRVYRRGGGQAHFRELIYSAHRHVPRSWDDTDGWYGTGSQAEYDHARQLPLCPECFLVMDRYRD